MGVQSFEDIFISCKRNNRYIIARCGGWLDLILDDSTTSMNYLLNVCLFFSNTDDFDDELCVQGWNLLLIQRFSLGV